MRPSVSDVVAVLLWWTGQALAVLVFLWSCGVV